MDLQHSADVAFMQIALREALKGVGFTHPNPAVGAVVVANGEVVGKGFHPRCGEPHAEAIALEQAGEHARGATIYVTLEPCCHHGRQGPCTEKILGAGIRRVVYAMRDPYHEVDGRGGQQLRAAGLEVLEGIGEARALGINEAWLSFVKTGRPFVTLKMSMSLDGRVCAADGTSRWVTSGPAQRQGHRLRAMSDAILVGVQTVITDDPLLTVRLGGIRSDASPIRIVLDSRLRIPVQAQVLRPDLPAATWVVTTGKPGRDLIRVVRGTRHEILTVPEFQGSVDLAALMEELARRNVIHLLVEGGPKVWTSFLRERRVDRLVAFLAPCLIGAGSLEEDPGRAVGRIGIETISQVSRLGQATWRRVGPDMMCTGRVDSRAP